MKRGSSQKRAAANHGEPVLGQLDGASGGNRWIVFSYTVPATDARARMRIWRRVTTIGAAQLKTGLQILPFREDLLEHITWLIGEVHNLGGEAVAIQCAGVEGVADLQIQQLFQAQVDQEFGQIQEEARNMLVSIDSLDDQGLKELAMALRKLRKRCESIRERDFFPSGAAARTLSSLDSLAERLRHPGLNELAARRLEPADFTGRTWVTRARPYVDRLGSAWLIRRFIDPRAGFRFLLAGEAPDLDHGELPYDMAIGDFTHRGELITFEVLVNDFGLGDPALARMSELIRFIDVQEGILPDDAALFKAMLDGLIAEGLDDHSLLERARLLFDLLYAGFIKTFQGGQ